MAVVQIPPQLRKYTGGQRKVVVAGSTVREVLGALAQSHPGVLERILDGDQLRPGYVLAIDSVVKPRGLHHRVRDSSEILFLPAAAGGA